MKVIIIGGGAAGIAAAYTLLQDKAPEVVLFEARGQYGGRAMTTTTIPNFAFDMGAQYVQDPTFNPWVQIAKDLKFDLVVETFGAKLRVDMGHGWVDEPVTTPDVQAVVDAIENSYATTSKQPNVVVMPKPRLDTISEVFGQAVSEFGPFSESAEVWQYIAADRARQRAADGESNYLVKKGLGTLIQTYGAGLKKKFGARFTEYLDTPVKTIAYTAAGVTVTSASGKVSISGDRCIVTTPVSILAGKAITFAPALPAAYTLALRSLRLGSYKKLALKLKTIPAAIAADTNYYLYEQKPEGIWQYYRIGYAPDVLVAHAAGDFATALDTMRDQDVIALFKASLEDAYPTKIAFAPGTAVTNWTKDPFAQGAYSYTAFNGGGPTDPAALKARHLLGAPLQTLTIAGEATSVDLYGTIAGAYNEGRKAALALLKL